MLLEVTGRKRRALQALGEKPIVHLYDLPPYIGRGTMDELVAIGLAEIVNAETGRCSKYFGWRLVQSRSEQGS